MSLVRKTVLICDSGSIRRTPALAITACRGSDTRIIRGYSSFPPLPFCQLNKAGGHYIEAQIKGSKQCDVKIPLCSRGATSSTRGRIFPLSESSRLRRIVIMSWRIGGTKNKSAQLGNSCTKLSTNRNGLYLYVLFFTSLVSGEKARHTESSLV